MKSVICKVTDAGKKKSVNQDALYASKVETQLYSSAFGIVCDGVGSCDHSEIASRNVVNLFADWYSKCYPYIADVADEDEFCSFLYEKWYALFDMANGYVFDFSTINEIKLGTTMSCILIRNFYYYILHIGDTRVYNISSDIKQLTIDHTVTAREVERGLLTEEQARKDKRRHSLTKCIGMKAHIRPEFYTGSFKGNSKFLICSDGFRDRTDDNEIANLFLFDKVLKKDRLIKAARKVIKNNRENGEQDNITAIVIQVSED